MPKPKKATIEVQGTAITVLTQSVDDYISLTDIAKFKNAEHSDDVIRNWLRNRNTVEFLGVSERLNNVKFNPVEFDGIRIQTGLNSFIRDHIATSLSIDPEDFAYTPFGERGGLGKAHQLFGEQLPKLLDELNTSLAA